MLVFLLKKLKTISNMYQTDNKLILKNAFLLILGTTLMRILLDVHSQIRCGAETRVIPMVLTLRNKLNRKMEALRLIEANLYPKAIDKATKQFILTIIQNAGRPAYVLCNKDPFSFNSLNYLSLIFPNAKFINMIRDGRAVIYSINK